MRGIVPIIAGACVLAVLAFALWNIGAVVAGIFSSDASQAQGGTEPSTIQESVADPGDIVIGLNGDEDTYVLTGEKYLEAGAHAAEPTDGILNDKIEILGDVDTSQAGDYTVTYRVKDSSGHVAEATRTVHVVDDMETQQDGIPIVMYHYVYSADNPPEDLNANYILDTDLDAQLAYLSENDYYFPSYPELKAFIEGGLAGKPSNLVIYATSNRRHLIRESMADRQGDDVRVRDTLETVTSLSDRFGLEITFSVPDKDEYLYIVEQLADESGLALERDELHLLAERFALRRNGRSPRTARQFISQQLAERYGNA